MNEVMETVATIPNNVPFAMEGSDMMMEGPDGQLLEKQQLLMLLGASSTLAEVTWLSKYQVATHQDHLTSLKEERNEGKETDDDVIEDEVR